jgi:hypothetical protein
MSGGLTATVASDGVLPMSKCGKCGTLGHNARTCKGGVLKVDAPQVPSARVARSGFSVTATITRVVYEPSLYGYLQVCYGVDDDGCEVVWTFHAEPPSVGDIVDVLGHSIIRYSGEDGPWGPAGVPTEKGDS